LALVVFLLASKADVLPIVLIDELETHLHYDAQADLVQMLAQQEQVSQVIFTTHSAGCLPPDLGTGVRIVGAAETQDRSSVENWPWAQEGGFGPLLLGMGASAMAFVPTRAAVIAEGASEVVMLPTLLREALALRSLPFQIAPGAAEASRSSIGRIDVQGSKVAWLVDGDAGGASNRRHLVNSGIPEERIVTLGGPGSGLTVEDLVDAQVFASAVAEELRRSHGESIDIFTVDAVPPTGRSTAVRDWCKQRQLPEPNKGALAHRIADQRSQTRLVSRDRDEVLPQLFAQLDELFRNI
jgi:predicted ATP-dependent endonuclease of OLD family